jgi:hypothetical protein
MADTDSMARSVASCVSSGGGTRDRGGGGGGGGGDGGGGHFLAKYLPENNDREVTDYQLELLQVVGVRESGLRTCTHECIRKFAMFFA